MDNNFFLTWAQVWKEIHIHLWLPSVNPSLFATAHPLATHTMPSSPPPPITMNINPNAASLFFFETLSMMAPPSIMTPLYTSNIMPLTISPYQFNDSTPMVPLMTMKHWCLYDVPSKDGTTLMHWWRCNSGTSDNGATSTWWCGCNKQCLRWWLNLWLYL